MIKDKIIDAAKYGKYVIINIQKVIQNHGMNDSLTHH